MMKNRCPMLYTLVLVNLHIATQWNLEVSKKISQERLSATTRQNVIRNEPDNKKSYRLQFT